MKNVYDEIQIFYDEFDDFDFAIEQATVEGYMRKKAWQGLDDQQLKVLWQYFEALFRYMVFANIYHLDELSEQEYIRCILWMDENQANFTLSEPAATEFLAQILAFAQYLCQKKLLYDVRAINAAKELLFPAGIFTMPILIPDDSSLLDAINLPNNISDDMAEQLNSLLEQLLSKIGLYYKNEEFSADFNRAISLYSGPFNTIPTEDSEDFWLGFWDYFLFDYHLIEYDITPLRYFSEQKIAILSVNENKILNDLLQAKFTVFYINRIVNPYLVECIDLMTNEKIQLPIPDYGMHDYKKVLLYGHIYAEGIVMLNYITSIQVSPKLRQRIKEEIIRQQRLYQYQITDANLDEFFMRHAVLVRHIIDILAHLAKVNVGLPDLSHDCFTIAKRDNIDADAAYALLDKLARQYKFGSFTRRLLLQMWDDFLTVNGEMVVQANMKQDAIAVFLSFSMINGMNFIRKKNFLTKLAVTEEAVNCSCNQLVKSLKLQIFDPRYLTEEGFVLSLYAF